MPNSTEKTMMILRSISDGKGKPVTLERISQDTAINKSTIAHITATLRKSGYLQRVSHNEGYIIGPELHFLTRYGRYGEDIIGVCHPILEYINRKTHQTAVFAVLGNQKKYIIDRVASQNIYSDGDAGILDDDIYRTVTGRVLLANCTPDKVSEIYNALGSPDISVWREASTAEGFYSQLGIIREDTCYYQRSINGAFVWHSFALPIYRSKSCIGALGLAIKLEGSAGSMSLDTNKYKALMIKCRKELERRLRFM